MYVGDVCEGNGNGEGTYTYKQRVTPLWLLSACVLHALMQTVACGARRSARGPGA